MNGIIISKVFSSHFIYNWAETDRTLLGQLKRVTKKHGGQTEAKTSIFKGLLLNNDKALGAVIFTDDFFFNAKETDFSGKDPYHKSSRFIAVSPELKIFLVWIAEMILLKLAQ